MIEAKKIYLIGIGGIGMSALARLFLSMGRQVCGSDLRKSGITEELLVLGVKIFIGHDAQHLRLSQPDMVIYSADITDQSSGYSELAAARELGIPVLTYAKALGSFMDGKHGVAVTGTNGKSTTAAMFGLILEMANLDPTVVLGTQLSKQNQSKEFQSNARLGKSQYVVVEADEYQRKMLETKPLMIVLTNVAEDHLDYYKNLSDIKQAFAEYARSLPADGMLIFNADDHNTVEVGREAKCHKFTFGIHHYADLQAMNIKNENGRQTFDLHLNDEPLGQFELKVPGLFNVSNALGAALAAIKLNVNPGIIKNALADFGGTWRRFEKLGSVGKTEIISDYGHHPAGIEATLKGAKDFYPGKKVLLVFQPHHRNRTKKLFGEFVDALSKAEHVIVPEIFDVAGREHGEQISSKQIVEELVKLGVDAVYAADLAETENLARKRIEDFDMIIFMGAGDIDSLARKMAHAS
jgi:UDP-N-acetylmuramate--alanine ligase